MIFAYDSTAGDPGFDFLVWLVEAEMFRRRIGSPAPLQIVFKHANLLDAVGQGWLANVWRPLLDMLRATESEDATAPVRSHPSYEHLFKAVVDAVERGETAPRLAADARACHRVKDWLQMIGNRSPVVITLRECDYSTHRNSDLQAWLAFARDLEEAGERVIFVRDTAKASESIKNFQTFPLASFEVRIRLALYEQAKMNFFVSNGPMMLAAFSAAPYCYLMTQYAGSQGPARYPWANDNQRIFYLQDTTANLMKVWRDANPDH